MAIGKEDTVRECVQLESRVKKGDRFGFVILNLIQNLMIASL